MNINDKSDIGLASGAAAISAQNAQNAQDDSRRISELQKEIYRLKRRLYHSELQLKSYKSKIGGEDTEEGSENTEENNHLRYTELLLRYCPAVIALLDANLRIILCTYSVVGITNGIGPDALIGNYVGSVAQKFMSYQAHDKLMKMMFRVIYDHVDQIDDVIYSEKADMYYGVSIIRYMDENEETAGAMLIARDQTEIMRARNQAEEASRAKSDFLATMSHEIRTPMNAIIGLQDAILSEPLTPRQKGYLGNMKSSSQTLLSIINDILDFSKIEAGKVSVESNSFNLRQMMQSLYDTSAVNARQKHLLCSHNFSPDLPEFVVGDENKIRQILNNLLSNSLKYTPFGFVEFSARLTSTGDVAPDGRIIQGEMLCFTVKDTGIGIKHEDIDKLFSPFEQLDLRRNKGVSGTGLGLAITYRLVHSLGGDIYIQSVYNEGSVFTVLLPFERSERAVKEDESPQKFIAPNVKALVVDDVDVNLIVAEAVLNEYRINPDTVLSGQEAVDSAANKDYDIIFVDQMMPGMDGMETTKRLRKLNPHNAKIPIIALTANIMGDTRARLIEAGCDGMLYKPIEIPKMERCLIKWLPKDKVRFMD
jgi:signal transduction histidine kinase/CheY-like chemotaxis protein